MSEIMDITVKKIKDGDHREDGRENGPDTAMFNWGPHKRRCTLIPVVFQIVLAATGSGSLVFGLNVALLNTSIAVIGQRLQWCGHDGGTKCTRYTVIASLIQTAVFLGAAIGSLGCGGIVKRRGARFVYLTSLIPVTVGISFSVAAGNAVVLGLARLLVGVGVGALSVAVPTYLAEMLPKDVRGRYTILHQLFVTIGIFIAVTLGLPFQKIPPGENSTTFNDVWSRVVLGIGIIPVIFAAYVFTFLFSFETPYYYVSNGRMADATELLRVITGREDVNEVLEEIQGQIRTTHRARENGMSFWKTLKSAKYGRIIFIGSTVSAFQQLTGINAFITNSNSLFESAGADTKLITILTVVLTLVNVIMSFPPIYLVEKLGRKKLFEIGAAGMALSVLPGMIMLWVIPNNLASVWVALAGAIIFICFFASTWGPVTWVYLFECFPSEIKDTASGAAAACNWIFGIAMVFAAGYLHTKIAYLVFCVLNAAGLLFTITIVKETKGRIVGDSPYLPSESTKAAEDNTKGATV